MTNDVPMKTEIVRFRCDPAQKSDMEAAARAENVPLSTWLRLLAIREAEKARKRARR